MRSTICEDGVRRILAKVEIPVGSEQISTYAMVHPIFHNSNDAMNEFENLNKRQLFNLAKESIRLYGTQSPTEMVSGRWSNKQIIRAKRHVNTLFPEVD